MSFRAPATMSAITMWATGRPGRACRIASRLNSSARARAVFWRIASMAVSLKRSGLQQVRGETVSQRVRRHLFSEVGPRAGLSADRLHAADKQWFGRVCPREKPFRRTMNAPVVTQHLKRPRREHDVAVLEHLSLLDADDHSLAVDVGDLEMTEFGNAQARGVDEGKHDTVFEVVHAFEKTRHLARAEHHGQALGLAGVRDGVAPPGAVQHAKVEKAQPLPREVDRVDRQAALLAQVEQVVPDFLQTEMARVLAEIGRDVAHRVQIMTLSGRREVPEIHLTDHALLEREGRSRVVRAPNEPGAPKSVVVKQTQGRDAEIQQIVAVTGLGEVLQPGPHILDVERLRLPLAMPGQRLYTCQVALPGVWGELALLHLPFHQANSFSYIYVFFYVSHESSPLRFATSDHRTLKPSGSNPRSKKGKFGFLGNGLSAGKNRKEGGFPTYLEQAEAGTAVRPTVRPLPRSGFVQNLAGLARPRGGQSAPEIRRGELPRGSASLQRSEFVGLSVRIGTTPA